MFSSLLMQECMCMCVYGHYTCLRVCFFVKVWMSPLDGRYGLLWGIPGAMPQYGNYQWVWNTSTETYTHTHTEPQPDSESLSLPLAHPLCCVCVRWNIRRTQPCHFQWWGNVDCSPEQKGLGDTLPVMVRQWGDWEAEEVIGSDNRNGDMKIEGKKKWEKRSGEWWC